MKNLTIVLTARCGSSRFPNKVVADVVGKPLIWWIVKRLLQTKNSLVVLATTQQKEDDILEDIARTANVQCYRHPNPDDVIGRVTSVVNMFPDTGYVLRALGDCPFISPEILDEAVNTLEIASAEAFAWMLPAETMPVYGSREFPYTIKAWKKIERNAKSGQREHVDMWYNHNRHLFKIVYHEPPPSSYFRLYRLEVDWPEDLELIRHIARDVGMLSPVPEINRYLDEHPDIAATNIERHEITGPTVSYNYKLRRSWYRMMQGQPVYDWEGNIWKSPDAKSIPVFCNSGLCLLGYGHEGQLYTKEGHVIKGYSRLTCNCGAGKIWRSPIRSGR